MRRRLKHHGLIKAFRNWFVFFLLAAFVITCSMMLFVSTLSANLNITLTRENTEMAAKLTFANVIIISLLFTAIDAVRRWFTVSRPVNKILEAAQKITRGDFSVRVKPVNTFFADDGFNRVIECFNKMTEELSGTETLRTDFIANVSHELKTPLSVMQNYGTLLQQPGLSEEKRLEYAKGITDTSRRFASLITNILKLNKLENQQIFPNVSEYNLSEQLCECLLQFESQWEQKNIDIQTDIEADVTIRSDSELLSLVWNNLFSNAIKFTGEGGRVSVALKATEHHVTVKVSDTGCGISREVGEHIFDKFYQGDASHGTQGNGLGLALVKRVVDIMHGEITVESEVGKGSTFAVRFRS